MSGPRELIQLTAFNVGDEEYVVDIMRVREIIRPLPLTPVRRGPRFVEGVINLRGEVIPVIHMRRRFDLPLRDGPHTRVIISVVDRRTVGLSVDRVTEVVRVPRSAIVPSPELFAGGRAPFFLGVCQHGERTLILLNLREVIASDEAVELPDLGRLAANPSPGGGPR